MATEAVREILAGIVDDVVESYELVVVLRVRDRPVEELALRTAVMLQGLEVLDTLTFQSPLGPATLTHLKVLKQHLPNLCGYHSLYNVLESGRYLQLRSIDRHYKVTHAPSFWKFHFRVTKEIAEECRRRGGEGCWTEENAVHGDLERDFLKFLMAGNDHIQELVKVRRDFQAEIVTFSFQFNHIQMGRREVMDVQAAIDRFLSTKAEAFIGCMMGVTNHWVSLVGHRFRGPPEFVFLDSRNRPYLRYDEAAIRAHYVQVAAERAALGRPAYTAWELDVAHQGVKDIQQSVSILMSCLTGSTTLQQEVLTQKLTHLLTHYNSIDASDELQRLETFFEAGFPAQFIYDDCIVHVLAYPKSALPRDLGEQLCTWVLNCERFIVAGRNRASWEAKYFRELIIGRLKKYFGK